LFTIDELQLKITTEEIQTATENRGMKILWQDIYVGKEKLYLEKKFVIIPIHKKKNKLNFNKGGYCKYLKVFVCHNMDPESLP